ncbi:PEPxxWA-CTERM sorting domain-containing protein [Phenylobacterium sp.]|uniref:PEPxxWA-CTERM sorting domain-containing protein n=1 Tax=Phenylobacterium sp. TaxID=1871053 RepID=UPI0011FE5E72|nr:PEPxxWA-CTERM sorting domain-containing protein [Phenylobacterium sp.]THD68263.1 MAG: PEP-CTERM sorting domain-containing protein [Phenylobacterium sp.]
MKIKLFAVAATAVGFLAMAGSASAVEVVSVSAVAGDTIPTGEHLITDFNSTGGADISGVGSQQGGTITDLAAGFHFTQDANAYTRDGVAGLDPGVSAPPPLDNGVAGAFYETVLNNGSATLTSDLGLEQFSFYMGSPDDYNHVTFTFTGIDGSSQTLNGVDIWGGSPPGDGNQSEGFTVTYTFTPDAVRSIQFTSTGNSFEFDRFAGIVPEPASWALMLTGFGLAGGMLRAKRRKAALA